MNNVIDSESARHYISLLQENINRMAANCTSCKNWLITIVSALFALQLLNSDLKPYLWISLIPTVLFLLLDAYYLGQEKRFRDLESVFVAKAKAGENISEELYSFCGGKHGKLGYFWKGFISPSTWILYAAMIVVVVSVCIVMC